MGKSKKKPRHRRRSEQKNKGKGAKQPDAALPPSSLTAVLQRIRHANAETRHATLAALCHTTFSCDELERATSRHEQDNGCGCDVKNKKKKSVLGVSTSLLQAIREQVMTTALDDKDILQQYVGGQQDERKGNRQRREMMLLLECAETAASCLTNYVTYHPDPNHELTAGWMILLTNRLQITAMGTRTATASTNKASNSQMSLVLLSLADQCLSCLVQLLERNPLAVERLVPDLNIQNKRTPQLRNNCLAALSEWLQLSAAALTTKTPPTSEINTPMDVDSPSSRGDASELWQSVRTTTLRCLHSLVDDNPYLVLPWLREEGSSAKLLLEKLVAAIQGTEKGPPASDSSQSEPPTPNARVTLAQLHAVGASMSCWQLVAREESDHDRSSWASPILESNLSEGLSVIRAALSGLFLNDSMTLHAKMDDLRLTRAALIRQEEDLLLERRICREQEQKKEPARLIARRLQQQNNADEEDQTARGRLPEDRQDARELWEASLQAWQDWVRPAQLALEILANTTAVALPASTDDEDVEMLDVDNRDPNSVVMTNPYSEQGSRPELDPALVACLMQHELPTELQRLLCQLTSSVTSLSSRMDDAPNHADDEVSGDGVGEIVDGALNDLLRKVAVCCSHLLAYLPSSDAIACWQPAQADVTSCGKLWLDLMNVLRCDAAATSAKEAAGDTMVVALRHYDVFRKQVHQEQLENLLKPLTEYSAQSISSTCSVGESGKRLLMSSADNSVLVRHYTSMLGILCSQEAHLCVVNRRVCQALLGALTYTRSAACAIVQQGSPQEKLEQLSSTIMVMSEVLNVFMDIYGNDDEDDNIVDKDKRVYHGAVFQGLGVLDQMQTSLPVLQNGISALERRERATPHNQDGRDDGMDCFALPAVIEQCKEIALNASRFVQYKRGKDKCK